MSGPRMDGLPPGPGTWWRPLPPTAPTTPSARAPTGRTRAKSFDAALADALAPLHFSSHAQHRLALSGRRLSDVDQRRLSRAVEKLAAKGAKESLLLLPDLALVVHVPTRTVITAVDGGRVREGIFTGIDSVAVL